MINGLVYERGYVSPLFVESMTQEGETGKQNAMALVCELEQPLILVVADKITEVSQIASILDICKRNNRSFLLFCEDLQEDPMSTMIYNNQKDIL